MGLRLSVPDRQVMLLGTLRVSFFPILFYIFALIVQDVTTAISLKQAEIISLWSYYYIITPQIF